MPTQETINDEESNEELDGQKPAAPDTSAQTLAAIQSLTKVISGMKTAAPATAADAGKKSEELGEFGTLLQTMLANGVPPKDLEPLVQLHLASQNDLKKQMKEMVDEEAGKVTKKSLDRSCFEVADSVLDDLATIDKPRLRQAYLDLMWEAMADEENSEFAAARAAYNRGVTPSKKDFEKAARLVLKSAPKEFSKTKGDSNKPAAQLDTGNSRPTPSKDYLTKTGDVDTSKLNDFEREIYTVAWNATHSKEIALHALKNIAPHMKH